MLTASETTDTSRYDSTPCTTAVSLEMSDEPKELGFAPLLWYPHFERGFLFHCVILLRGCYVFFAVPKRRPRRQRQR